MSSSTIATHLASILPTKGARLEIARRQTPEPGPNELLIEVKSVALNPVDYFQRDLGIFITQYPSILGSDVAGIIVGVGSSVANEDLKVGARVAAFATCFYEGGAPKYGAFQALVVVPAANAVPIPEKMSFNEASLLPMAVETAWAGWYSIGIARDTKYTAADKQGMLVWGAASSVGSAALQIAKLLGFTVYITASEKHHAYLTTLGASRTFDYKDEGVVGKILKAVKEDGLTIRNGYAAVPGVLGPCMEILKETKGEKTAMLASAPRVPEDLPTVQGVDVKFISPPKDTDERTEHFKFVFNIWLKQKLATGEYVPSPAVQVVNGGLESLNKGLDELKSGVSGVKLVIEV